MRKPYGGRPEARSSGGNGQASRNAVPSARERALPARDNGNRPPRKRAPVARQPCASPSRNIEEQNTNSRSLKLLSEEMWPLLDPSPVNVHQVQEAPFGLCR